MTCSQNTTYCVSSQLDLFQGHCKQISLEKNAYVAHFPVSSLSLGPIEFDVPASPMYTDLSETRLYLRAKVVKVNGENVDPGVQIVPCNMLLHALFSRVDVYLNGQMITQSTNTYPWKAGIETILNFGKEAKESQLRSIFYYKDDLADTGMNQRFAMSASSKEFELLGPLHVDYFFQPKYMVNHVPMRIVLHRTNPNFYLHAVGGPGGERYKIVITQANLFVRRAKVSTDIELAHAKALQKCNAIYPMHQVRTELSTIPAGSSILVKEGIFGGKIPRKLVIVLLSGESLNGGYDDSPMRFRGEFVRRIDITLDGEPVADTPLSCDFENDLYMRAYNNMFAAMNKSYANYDTDITLKDFKEMYGIFCFDLTSDSCGNTTDHSEMERQGTLRIMMGLTGITTTMYALFYGEFEGSLEITQARNIIIN